MCERNDIDDFDFPQIDECGDDYYNDSWRDLTEEDYTDLFLENFN